MYFRDGTTKMGAFSQPSLIMGPGSYVATYEPDVIWEEAVSHAVACEPAGPHVATFGPGVSMHSFKKVPVATSRQVVMT